MRKSKQNSVVVREPTVPVVEEVHVRGRRRAPIEGLRELHGELLEAGPVKQGRVTLSPVMVKTHPAHPNQIVGDGESGIPTLAYVITQRKRELGHVLVHAHRKYVVIAPRIQSLPSTHLNLAAAALRAEIAAEDVAPRETERRSA